jgi:hypothetical protein
MSGTHTATWWQKLATDDPLWPKGRLASVSNERRQYVPLRLTTVKKSYGTVKNHTFAGY